MADETKEILPDITNIKSQETYTLPSKGLVYDEADNIPASITIRRMTTKEDKIRFRNDSSDKIRRDILQACIMDPGVDVGKLKIFDANLLLFRLRSLSLLNDKYKVQCYCNMCNTNFIHELNLSDIPVEYMTKEKLKTQKIVLPLSKDKIDLKSPSLNDSIIMTEKIRKYGIDFPDADINSFIMTTSMALYIDKVNGHKLLSEELEQYLDDMDIIDSRFITQNISTVDSLFGFKTDLKTLCPSCKSEVTHGLPITSELFTPSN